MSSAESPTSLLGRPLKVSSDQQQYLQQLWMLNMQKNIAEVVDLLRYLEQKLHELAEEQLFPPERRGSGSIQELSPTEDLSLLDEFCVNISQLLKKALFDLGNHVQTWGMILWPESSAAQVEKFTHLLSRSTLLGIYFQPFLDYIKVFGQRLIDLKREELVPILNSLVGQALGEYFKDLTQQAHGLVDAAMTLT